MEIQAQEDPAIVLYYNLWQKDLNETKVRKGTVLWSPVDVMETLNKILSGSEI